LTETTQDLRDRIKILEHELERRLDDKEQAFRYTWSRGKAIFEQEVLGQHRQLKVWLPRYVLQSRALVLFTAPIIYLGISDYCESIGAQPSIQGDRACPNWDDQPVPDIAHHGSGNRR
jgi:hypothetical protein